MKVKDKKRREETRREEDEVGKEKEREQDYK